MKDEQPHFFLTVGYCGFFALVTYVTLGYVTLGYVLGCGMWDCVHNVLHIHIYSLSTVEYDDDVDDGKSRMIRVAS